MSEPTGRGRWKRLFGESALIVGSILLAFAIDAAWDERQERALEREYVEGLMIEMGLAADELREDMRRRGEWVAWSDSIVEEASSRTAPDTTVNKWIQGASMGMARFFPPSSVLDELVSSGNLSLLSSRDLRYELLSYQRGRERLNFIGDWGRAGDEDGLRPYLTQHFRWRDATPQPILPDGTLPRATFRPISVPPGTIQSMLDDPVFENLMLIRRFRLGLVQRRSEELARLIDDVIALLESEAERLGID